MLAALPSSSNYKLNNYGFGNGGTSNSASTNYNVNGLTGEQSTVKTSSGNFSDNGGNNGIQQANVPTVAISNPSNYYNKLLLVLDTQGNPSDTLYAIAVSTDNFSTTNYVKSDGTIGGSLAYPSDYRTYASWGSGSGSLVIGLSATTTYYVKAKAISGKFTESAYGPVASASTVGPQLSFSVSPSSLAIGTLLPGTVVTAAMTIDLAIATNGEQGGAVYIADSNGALTSSVYPSASISSATDDLGTAGNGYGMQVASSSQTSGGPLAAQSPYNGSGDNVGIVSSLIRKILDAPAPIVGGTGSINVKAKAAAIDAAAADYADIVTLVASGSF